MITDFETNGRIHLVKEYFRRGDAGDPTIIQMFTDDVELRFPKFGTQSGKAAVGAFVQGLLGEVRSLSHYPKDYTYIASGDIVVAEGWESGILKDGTTWPAKGTSDGKFCNIFRFRGHLISHVHIYVDPDFGGKDHERFFWGLEAGSPEAR
jgi:SnoaL-like domain